MPFGAVNKPFRRMPLSRALTPGGRRLPRSTLATRLAHSDSATGSCSGPATARRHLRVPQALSSRRDPAPSDVRAARPRRGAARRRDRGPDRGGGLAIAFVSEEASKPASASATLRWRSTTLPSCPARPRRRSSQTDAAYASSRMCTGRRAPCLRRRGVSQWVSPHDRFGLPVGAQADECYGDQAQSRDLRLLAAGSGTSKRPQV